MVNSKDYALVDGSRVLLIGAPNGGGPDRLPAGARQCEMVLLDGNCQVPHSCGSLLAARVGAGLQIN